MPSSYCLFSVLESETNNQDIVSIMTSLYGSTKKSSNTNVSYHSLSLLFFNVSKLQLVVPILYSMLVYDGIHEVN